MDFQQLHFINNSKPAINTDNVKNGTSKSLGLLGLIANYNNSSKNNLILRLQKTEELNVYLENLVEQRTKELNEVVGTNAKFVSIIAHDLRSPFCSILIVLEKLKESLNDHDINEIEKYVNMAFNSAYRTLNLLDNLLAWTISQNREKKFNPVKINLHDVLIDEIECINISAKQKQIRLNYSITSNVNILADLQMVKTILRNLISNAIKFTNNGGEITVTVLKSKQFIEIAIKDTGIGISSEAQRRLFKIDEFHSTPGTNNEKGTGLGLLLCKEFVEINGGNIWIESEPGKGSEFKFTLPRYLKKQVINPIPENV
jgi:signal transduction histidine kinase